MSDSESESEGKCEGAAACISMPTAWQHSVDLLHYAMVHGNDELRDLIGKAQYLIKMDKAKHTASLEQSSVKDHFNKIP